MPAEPSSNQGQIKGECVNKTTVGQQAEFSYHGDSKYAGDLVDLTATAIRGKYECLNYSDASDLLFVYDEQLIKGGYRLYDWQLKLHIELAAAKPTFKKPHKFCLVAANGSGKDAIIAAPFAVWFALCKIQARVIITSSSGTQLTSQTEPAIRNLCEKINAFHGEEIFRIRQRYITCRLSGSEIRMFATDEAGKAEGYHPIIPGAEMAILVNEGKSVSEEIHGALRRCTGYNYWLEYSSPGEPTGFFYNAFKTWEHSLRVTSFDCPEHLSEAEREQDKIDLGEHSALYRSKHLALFTSLSGQVIITQELLDKLLLAPPHYDLSSWPDRIGIDIAAGGDENCIIRTKGNKVTKEIAWREKDTTLTADRIDLELTKMNISKNHPHIYADDGGIGHAVIDMLMRKGWEIKRIMNQWPAIVKKNYGNRGAENWYRVNRILEELLFDISGLSTKALEQLTSRRYKQQLTGARIFLEAKKEAIAHGRPSPDRADAFILSLTGLTVDDFLGAKVADTKGNLVTTDEVVLKTAQEALNYYEENITYGLFNGIDVLKQRRTKGRIHSSLEAAMKN